MDIIKQNGSRQKFMPNKIMTRIKKASKDLNVDVDLIFKDCVQGLVDEMTTEELDKHLANVSANKMILDYDYSMLAGRLLISRQSKKIGVEAIDSDYLFDFMSFQSFLHKYSIKNEIGEPIELPHMMYRRVSDYLFDDKKDADVYYDELRWRKISVATPQLMNAGTDRHNLISCNITSLVDDSKEGILKTLDDISISSSDGAGIGLHPHNLRSRHTLVESFKGFAGGVVRFCDMVQSHMRFFKQGNRSGSAAVYLGIWHRDIEDFLELRLQIGEERNRTRDLFTAVCIPDLFYEKLNSGDDDWYLFCPHQVKKAGFEPLYNCYGDDFKELYGKLVESGIGHKVSVKKVWSMILKSLSEAGLPYVWNWCNANKRNPQSNIGIRRGSNLCVTEDTLLLTDKGNIPIKELANTTPKVWNGVEFTEAHCGMTSPSANIYKVILSDGNELKCTDGHEWIIQDNYNTKPRKVATKDLKIGTKLAKWELPNESLLYKEHLTVKDVIDLKTKQPTYCVHEPKLNNATFNNILTGNCMEFYGVSRPNYTSQCDLGLIPLHNLKRNDFDEVARRIKILTYGLNKAIDKNRWSTEGSKNAGEDQRTIGIGIAGLADYFAKEKIAFDSQEALDFNEKLFETIYNSAKKESSRLAVEYYGESYPAWEGSIYDKEGTPMSNSLLVCPMPSASTSTLMGVYEMFEPVHSNIYLRRLDVGEFTVVNKYLQRELQELNLWTPEVRNLIMENEGSIQNITMFPEEIRNRYKTIFEYKQKALIDLAIARQKNIDQGQSMNLYFNDATTGKIGGALNYAWKNGLPTGSYYVRTESLLKAPTRLAVDNKPTKPENSDFECFGCTS